MRIALLIALIFCSCQSSRKAGKSDDEFDKALKESEAKRSEKLDFLADEKLPNEEYIVTDSAVISTDDFVEIRPERFAAFRVQIFAGTPENAFKTITEFTSRDSLKPAYVIQDTLDGLWRVWIGDCQDRKEADTLKATLIAAGYAGAWVVEMKSAATEFVEKKLWWLQLGSFQSRAAAEKAMERVPAADDRRIDIREIQGTFKLRVGGYPDRSKADQLKKEFTDFKGAFVVQDP